MGSHEPTLTLLHTPFFLLSSSPTVVFVFFFVFFVLFLYSECLLIASTGGNTQEFPGGDDDDIYDGLQTQAILLDYNELEALPLMVLFNNTAAISVRHNRISSLGDSAFAGFSGEWM
jgi:hypothetical protein